MRKNTSRSNGAAEPFPLKQGNTPNKLAEVVLFAMATPFFSQQQPWEPQSGKELIFPPFKSNTKRDSMQPAALKEADLLKKKDVPQTKPFLSDVLSIGLFVLFLMTASATKFKSS